jgi:hypothetical protein
VFDCAQPQKCTPLCVSDAGQAGDVGHAQHHRPESTALIQQFVVTADGTRGVGSLAPILGAPDRREA